MSRHHLVKDRRRREPFTVEELLARARSAT
jgi:hypothetical protein